MITRGVSDVKYKMTDCTRMADFKWFCQYNYTHQPKRIPPGSLIIQII
nr:MAG TPA: hypothetical protein [Caudoviricetes sp.]